MDKRTRVKNALHNLPADRVPVGFWFHFEGEQATGQACIDAHMRYYDECDVDFAKIMCDGFFDFELTTPVHCAKDWYDLKPMGREHPYIKMQLERVKAVNDRLGGRCMSFYNVYAPFSSMRFGAGDERVMAHLKEDPDAVMYGLSVIAEGNALLAELCVTECGCDGVYYCVQGGETDRFTHEQYRQYITPSDLLVLSHANRFSEDNILHCCGWAGITNRMENWYDYPSAAVNWAVHIEGLGLAEGRRRFGGRAVMGGFDNRREGVLYSGTKEQVQAYAKELLTENGPTGYLIGADCTLPADIDTERIRWVMETAAAWGEGSRP